jgi:hypothetical protein
LTTEHVFDMLAGMESAVALGEVLDEVSGHLNAQHARLVDAAVVMLANPSWWCGVGMEEPHQFLCWRTALSPARARQVVSIARRVGELPACMGRFRAGELSIDQMAAIAKRAPWWTDQQMADLAAMLTVSQLRRMLSSYPFPVVPEPAEASDDEADARAGETTDGVDGVVDAGATEDADEDESAGGVDANGAGDEVADGADSDGGGHDGPDDDAGGSGDGSVAEEAWWGWGDDGRFRLHLEVDPDSGLVLEQALSEAHDRLFNESGVSVSRIDAVRDVAERALDRVEGGSRRDRYRVHLHLDVDGVFTDAAGRHLPDSIRRHISCDGTLSPVFHQQGVPVSVGRAQRVIPPRLRRLVGLRDGGACRVPGCGADRFVEIHHIIHWQDHGRTESPNLICLCPHHHRMHHRGQLGITGDADQPDGFTFTNRHGRVIANSGARPTPPGAPPLEGCYRHPLGERLDTHALTFTPPTTPAV